MEFLGRDGPIWKQGMNVTPPGGGGKYGNHPPQAAPDVATVDTGQTVSLDVLANDTDPEGGALTLISAKAVLGAALIVGNRLSYTAGDATGTDTVTYEVADPEGQRSTGTLTVTINALPVGAVDIWLVDPATDRKVTPLTDGQTIARTLLAGDRYEIEAVPDPTLGATSVRLTQGTRARLENTAPYVLFYEQDGDYGGALLPVGPQTLTVEVFSGILGTGTLLAARTVTYTFVEAPVLMPQPDVAIATAGVPVLIDVLANDTASGPLTLVSASAENGTATLAGNLVSYTAITGFTGTDTLNYVVRDESGQTGSAQVAVEVRPESGGTGPQAVEIRVNRSEGVAPAGVFFRAVATGFSVPRPDFDLRYRWVFGDAGRFGAPRRMDATPWGNDRNIAYGPWTAHAFRTPGAYEVTCEVTDGTHTARSAPLTITVIDPDVFPRTSTVVVAPDGDFEGLDGILTRSRDLNEICKIASNGGGRARIRLKRGFTYAAGGYQNPAQQFVIDTWGHGARPIIECMTNNGLRIGGAFFEVALSGLDFQGGWNPRDESGESHMGVLIEGDTACPVTLHDCCFSGHDTAVHSRKNTGESEASAIMFSDSVITGWREFGYFGGAGKWAAIGSRLEQDYDANGGGKPSYGAAAIANGQCPVRFSDHRASDTSPAVFRQSELFSNNGWPMLTHGVPAHQPCVRYYSETTGYARVMMDGSIFEGGTQILSAGRLKDPAMPADWIIDKCAFVMTPVTQYPWEIGTGATIRNSLFFWSRAKRRETKGRPNQVFWLQDTQSAEAKQVPVEIYSNSLIDWTDAAELEDAGDPTFLRYAGPGTSFKTVLEENNVWHRPHFTNPVAENLDLGRRMFAPIYRGLKWVNHWNGIDQGFYDKYGPGVSPRDPDYALPDCTIPPDIGAGEIVSAVPHGPLVAWHTIADERFTIDDTDGTIRRSDRGSLRAGEILQIGATTTLKDDEASQIGHLLTFRVIADLGPAQPQIVIPVPRGPMPAAPGTRSAIDYADGTLRGAAPARGAIGPA